VTDGALSADVFELRPPSAAAVPVLVSIPHTGVRLTAPVRQRLASAAMAALPMTDWHLHDLYAFLPALGMTTLCARYSRFVIDLNRGPDARPLYPGRFETGLVPLETFGGEPVFDRPPTAAEIERRAARYHAPYHIRLQEILNGFHAAFGMAVLVDAHSVASTANRLHGALDKDIYLGDRDGATCRPWLRDCLLAALAQAGLEVAVNDPYKGGYITDHYGRQQGVEAIQIEMCQRVYMDESEPGGAVERPRFRAASAMLRRVFEALRDAVEQRLINRPA
jgi:N-formylglutamate deformylase